MGNRCFRYGDGFFETIRCLNGKLLGFDYHLERIEKSEKILKINLSQKLDKTAFLKQISELLQNNNYTKAAKVRFSLIRDETGQYNKTENKNVQYLIESFELENNYYTLNKKGLTIGVFDEISKSYNIIGSLKTSNSLIYVLACIFA